MYMQTASARVSRGRLSVSEEVYLTTSVPFIPAAKCPAKEQM